MQATEKEEFRHYLENSGVIDALTKVLVGLYEEGDKPQNPLEFIKQQLSSILPGGSSTLETEALKRENEELKKKIEELNAKIESLTASSAPTDKPAE